jgi:hypothetical protein
MPTPKVLKAVLLAAAAAGAANPPPVPSSEEALQAYVDFSTMDLTSEQWEAKFKYLDDNKGVYGSMRKAADMFPVVPYNTLKGRYLKRESAPTTFGPKPVLGLDVETVIVDFCKQQHARGFSVPKVFIIARAKKAAVDLGGDDAAASIGGKKWYKGFMKRHPDVKEMNSSLMEEERTHAVGRESVGRYFTLADVALTGGLVPFNRACVDESHFGPSDLYKTETAPKAPNGKRLVLTPTPEYVQKLKAELHGTPGLTAQLKAKLAAAPRTQMSQIMSYSECFEAEIDKQIEANAEAKRKAEFPWNKMGITYKEYCKRERERKDAEKAAEKDAKAAAKAAKAKPAVAALPLAGKKRKVSAVEPAKAAVAALPAAAPVAIKGPAQTSARGRVVVKKARLDE